MATTLERPSATTQVVSYGEFIDGHIRRTRAQIKWVEFFANLVLLVVGLASALFCLAIVDHWLMPLPVWSRWLAFLGLSGGSMAFIALRVAPLLVRRVNPVYAAHAIEEQTPTLKNALVNLLLLRSNPRDASAPILEAVEQQAATGLTHVPAEGAVDRSHLIKLGYVLIAVLAISALYKFISPKDPLATFGRVVAPWASIAAPTRVEIAAVTPGNTSVFTDAFLTVEATVHGLRQGDAVTLHYHTLDGRLVNQTIPLAAVPDKPARYRCVLPAGTDGLQHSVRYHVQAGDARSAAYEVQVLVAPAISVRKVEYVYPAYARRPPRTDSDVGDLVALEGTQVTLQAEANQEIDKAYVDFQCDGQSDLQMTVQGKTASVSFPLRMSTSPTKGRAPLADSYQILFSNKAGHHNPHPVKHKIDVIPDLPPEVAIIAPAAAEIQVPANGAVTITVSAKDADFALKEVQLLGERAAGKSTPGEDALLLNHYLLREEKAGPFQSEHAFVPAELKLNAGDVIRVFAVARDNRPNEPNVARSKRLLIQIVAPIEPPENPEQKNHEQHKRESPNEPQRNNQQKNEDQSSQNKGSQTNKTGESGQNNPQQPKQNDAPHNEGQKNGELNKPQQPKNNGEKNQGQGGNSKSEPMQGQGGGQQPNNDQPQNGENKAGGMGQSGSRNNDSKNSSQPRAGQQPRGAQGGGSRQNQDNPSGAEPGNPAGSADSGRSGSAGGQNSQQPGQPSAQPRQEQVDPARDPGRVFEKLNDLARQQQNNRNQQGADEAPAQNQQGGSGTPKGGANMETQGQGPRDPKSDKSPTTGQEKREESGATKGANENKNSQAGRDKPADQQKHDANAQGQGAANKGAGLKNENPPQRGERDPDKKGGDPDHEKGQAGAGDPTKNDTGSPTNQEANRPTNNKRDAPPSKGPEANDEHKAQSPGGSKRESNSQGSQEGDRSGGGKQGGGQSSNNEGTGGAGQNTASDEGASKAPGAGKGETGDKAGDAVDANKPTRRAGDKSGNGSQQKPGQGDQSTGKQGNGGAAEIPSQGKPQPNSGDPQRGAPGQGGANADRSGGTPSPQRGSERGNQENTNRQNREEGLAPPPDDPNLEHARKATDLVLNYLRDELNKEDAEQKLKELGWTREQMREFLSRWEKVVELSKKAGPEGEKARDQLRNLGLRPAGSAVGSNQRNDQQQGLSESLRIPAPPEYSEQYKLYQQGRGKGRPPKQ